MIVRIHDTLKILPESTEDQIVLSRAKFELTMANPAFRKAERAGRWTRDIPEELFFYEGNSLPRGYLDRFLALSPGALCVDHRLSLDPVEFAFSGSLRGYQEEAVETMARYKDGVLCAPCGAGKTVMGLALIARKKQPALVLVHTKDLLHQWQEVVGALLGIEAGIIGGGKRTTGPVTIATIQTLQRGIPEEVRLAFGLVLVDECHHTPARTFSEVIQVFPARYRYGLTATPEREDGLTRALHFAIGPARHEILRGDLQDAGVSLRPRLYWQPTSFQYLYRDDYQEMLTAMSKDQSRNRLITDLANRAREAGRVILVLSSRVDHCHDLAAHIPGAVVATGTTNSKDRREILSRVREGKAGVLVASTIADEGLDLPCLDTLILALPFRAKGRAVQRIGRIMRPSPGKSVPVVVDLLDSRVPILRHQAKRRYLDAYVDLFDAPAFPGAAA